MPHPSDSSLNASPANSGAGYPRSFCSKAPDTLVRDVMRGRLVLSRMGSPQLRNIIQKLAERIRELEAREAVKPKTIEPRRRAKHD